MHMSVMHAHNLKKVTLCIPVEFLVACGGFMRQVDPAFGVIKDTCKIWSEAIKSRRLV